MKKFSGEGTLYMIFKIRKDSLTVCSFSLQFNSIMHIQFQEWISLRSW